MSPPRRLAWAILLLAPLAVAALVLIPHRPTPVALTRPVARPVLPRPTPTPTPTETPYVIRRVLDTGGPIRFGRWFWDEAGVPAGEVVITVDTAAETLSIFRAGYEIGATAITYGADHKPTPLGVFPITQKDADHVSNLYGAPMPYMLRLTNDGVSIHGGEVAPENATHGCIGVPVAFAKKLFAAVKLGDRVVVTRGEQLQLGSSVGAARER